MTKKMIHLSITAVLFLLLAGWSPASASPETGSTQPFSPAYKTKLPKNYTMHDFLVYLVKDVDAFWSPIMVSDGHKDPAVTHAFPAKGKPISTKCEIEDPVKQPAQAFYCHLDDRLVITQEMAKQLQEGTIVSNNEPRPKDKAGDFSVAVIVAHEYAHNLQAELGWITSTGYLTTSRSIELNADCLAGVWANSSYYKGLLDKTDVKEALRTLSDIGQDTKDPNPTHGTPKERVKAFLLGYDSGSAPKCDHYLNTKY